MELVPTFGLIRDIIVFDVDCFHFICEVLQVDHFSHHFHSYQVYTKSPPHYICCEHSDVYDHTALEMYTLSQPDHYFIPLKYQIID